MGWTDSSIVSGVVIICMLITASACWLTVRCVQRETSPLQTVRRLNWISLLVVLHVVVTAVGLGVSGRLNRPPHEFIPEVSPFVWGNMLLSALAVFLILRIRSKVGQAETSVEGDPQGQVRLHLQYVGSLGWVAFLCGLLLIPLVLGGLWMWLTVLPGCLLLIRYGDHVAVKVLLCGLCLVPVVFLVGNNAGIFCVTGLLVFLKFTAELLRSRRQCHLLWLLDAAVRSRRSLPDELRNHALEFRGIHASTLRQLANELESGLPLGSALLVARDNVLKSESDLVKFLLLPVRWCRGILSGPHGLLPAWVIAAIRAAEKTGTLDECLSQTASRYLNSIRSGFSFNGLPGFAAYVLVYLLGPGIIVAFLAVSIMPQYEKLFDEGFLKQLPGATVAVNQVLEMLIDYWFLAVPPVLWLFLILLRYGLGDPLAWKDINARPFAKWFRPFDAPDLLRDFSAAIRAGQPLPEILDAVKTTHQRTSVRKQLTEVSSAVEAGGDVWELLAAGGFLRSVDVQCIRFADRAGNLPWVLNELAARRERTQAYRVQLLLKLAEPVAIITLGICCMLIIVAFFMPMIAVIGELSLPGV